MATADMKVGELILNSAEKSGNIEPSKGAICNLSFADSKENPPQVQTSDGNLISFDSCNGKGNAVGDAGEDSDDEDIVYRFTYLGTLPVDRRYIAEVYQWVVREMSLNNCRPRPVKVSMTDSHVHLDFEEENTLVNVDDSEKEPDHYCHSFKSIVRLSRLKAFENCFAYIVATGEGEQEKCVCHAFQAESNTLKNEFLKKLKRTVLSKPTPLPVNSPRRGSLMKPVSTKRVHRRVMSSSNIHLNDTSVYKYSVCYVGKVTVSQPQTPPKFIDNVVKQLRKIHHTKLKPRRSNNLSPSKSLRERLTDVKPEDAAMDNNSSCESLNNGSGQLQAQGRSRSASDGEQGLPQLQVLPQQRLDKCDDQPDGSAGDEDKSRLVMFQISQSSLMLFSSSSKQLLLEKKIQDISYCTKGDTKSDHFGFICRENGNHVCYVFFADAESMVDAIMRSIKQAFTEALEASAHLTLCDTCPLQILHTLCLKLDGAAISEQQSAVHECSRELMEGEHLHLMNKLHEYSPKNDFENIKVIVALLREVIGDRQKLHKHVFTSQAMSLSEESRDRSKSTFLEKAKKSFGLSFEGLMSRRGRTKTVNDGMQHLSTDEDGSVTTNGNDSLSPRLRRNSSAENINERRPRSRTFHSCPTTPKQNEKFFPSDSTANELHGSDNFRKKDAEPKRDEVVIGSLGTEVKPNQKTQQESWRQAMYNSVVSPSRRSSGSGSGSSEVLLSGDPGSIKEEDPPNPKEMARIRWQKAIKEQILLIRMEKENHKLNNNIRAAESRRQKLSYKEYNTCTCESIKAWDELLIKCTTDKVDDNLLLSAVRGGVPKFRRGEVWQLLVDQHRIRRPDFDNHTWRETEYNTLMRQETTHQHAILIDLGRTFPSHEYFTCQLGPGQISLFNMLKAYSSLDEEVGYCQGLSFVAGLLLMHMPEQEAFDAFRHVMYGLGIRNQYKPNMNAVMQQQYQWSRLLRDCHPAIHEHFHKHDVTPTLYAAPWFLTLFASQFPLGFSSRVLDLVFLQGLDVIFKVALVLVGNHSQQILALDGFEYIVEYLKTELPLAIPSEADDVIRRAVDLEIRQQLNLYEAEYQLLHEMSELREKCEKHEATINTLQQQNVHLKEEALVAKDSVAKLKVSLSESEEARRCLSTASRIVQHERDMLQLTVNALRDESSTSNEVAECSRELINNTKNGVAKSNGASTMDRSWELVPSPTTVQLEMRSPIERLESYDSTLSRTSSGSGNYGCNGVTNPSDPDSPRAPGSGDSGEDKATSSEQEVPLIAVKKRTAKVPSGFPLLTDGDTY